MKYWNSFWLWYDALPNNKRAVYAVLIILLGAFIGRVIGEILVSLR